MTITQRLRALIRCWRQTTQQASAERLQRALEREAAEERLRQVRVRLLDLEMEQDIGQE